MNILNRLTIRNLKLNKVRTSVTIVGIILAVILITATIGLGSSFYKSLIIHEQEESGDYHVKYLNLSDIDRNRIINDEHVDNYYFTNEVGYAKANISNKIKKYVKIIEYSSKAFDANNISLIEGRLPKDTNEIVIPKKMFDYGFEKKIGDEITLNVGKLLEQNETTTNVVPSDDTTTDVITSDELINDSLNELDDELVNTTQQIYTIVGIIDELNYSVEYEELSYIALTYNDNISNPSSVYIKYNKPSKTLEYICPKVTNNNKDKNNCLNNVMFSSAVNYEYNDSLLVLYGVGLSTKVKLGIISILCVIISIISISCMVIIKNSFSISVNERYKQYGMLSSIGATSKQIRKNVLFEGTIEGIISIPLGVLLGSGVVYFLVDITNNILKDSLTELGYGQTLYFSIPVIALIIIIIVSALTIYLSCLIPAIKISKISPIEAIRNNNEIKIKKKKMKSSKIIKYLFGIGGVIADKNLKRNKRKYRTTVLSLTVSVILFICISAGVNQSETEIKALSDGIKYNASLMIYYDNDYNTELTDDELKNINQDMKNIFETIGKSSSVEKYSYANIIDSLYRKVSDDEIENHFKYDSKEISYEEYQDNIQNIKDKGLLTSILVVNDDEFNRLSKNLKLNDEDLKNGVLVYNYNHTIKNNGEIKKERYLDLSIAKEINLKQYDSENESNIPLEEFNVKILGEVDLSESLLSNEFESFTLVVSNKFIEVHPTLKIQNKLGNVSSLYIYSSSIEELEKYINTLDIKYDYYLIDWNKELQNYKNLILIMNIFVYTFIIIVFLIAITNIFNTISTSMMLRKKEFAMLRSIGMTDKEYRRMIILESVLYSFKSLLNGLLISLFILYIMYNAGTNNTFINKIIILFNNLPYINILLSILIVVIFVLITMFYSLSKINKQNIIDTIRNDNI